MRTKKAFFGYVAILGTAGYLVTVGCGSSNFSGDDDGTGSDAGGDGSDTIINPNCDHTQLPSQNICVVDDAAGVFVSGVANGGNDGADGTLTHPFATIQKGIAAAKDAKKRVYVCIGDYAEQVAFADGVSIFGDLDCTAEWKYVPTQHARVKAPTSPAASANQIQSATRIEGLDITAPDGTPSSRSSVALIVGGSPGLTVANATILAGNGLDGTDGVEGIQLIQTSDGNGGAAGTGGERSPQFLNDTVASCPNYRPVPSPECPSNAAGGGTTSCSAPADAGVDAAAYQPGSGGAGGQGSQCVMADTCTGPSATVAACCTGTPDNGGAQPGTSATAAGAISPSTNATAGSTPIPGANGQNGVASWVGLAFGVADGSAGKDGTPGQGGGGGAGGNPFFVDTGTHKAAGDVGQGPSGSGGGAGGCPGLAGSFGTGGGASIAIVTDTAFTLDTCIVKSANGGKAGQGTFGSNPTNGGLAGPTSGSGAQLGAPGAAGSPSGWSGNGSAGPSYGIAAHGSTPLLKSTVPQAGTGGKGVPVRTQGTKVIPATPDAASNANGTF